MEVLSLSNQQSASGNSSNINLASFLPMHHVVKDRVHRPPITRIEDSLAQSCFILRESDVMIFWRVLEEDLLDAVFDSLSDKDEGDFDCDNEIHVLGEPIVLWEDLMAANLGEEDGNDPTKHEEHFDHSDLMAGPLDIAGRDHDDEEVRLPLVASVMGSSNTNPDVSAIDDDLSDREVLVTYTVWIKPKDRAI